MNKRALITGINGQDGSYLSRLLLEKNYEIHGIVKRNSVSENQTYRIEDIRHEMKLHYADMVDSSSLVRVMSECQPHEIYNLAAQSHVQISFDQPIYTTQSIVIGTLNLLETIRILNPKAKLYQASSSEMFGNTHTEIQTIDTPMNPVSPYGCAKLAAHNLCDTYRDAYNLNIACGVLFNHESPMRGTNFVTNKVVKEAVRIYYGLANELVMGNLEAKRDWGHAKDYVKAMWLMLQQNICKDYIVATGTSYSVRELCEYVFKQLDMNYKDYVKEDIRYIRKKELHTLKGDSTPIRIELGWKPEYNFESLLDEMIAYWKDYYGGINK